MTPQERRQTILTLLDHWQDFFDRANPGDKTLPAEPSALLDVQAWSLFSSMGAHPSVRELLRLLTGLRARGPAHYGCVLAWFGAPWRTTDRPVKRRNAHGRMVDDVARVRERVLSRELAGFPRCSCGCGLPRPVCTSVDVLGAGWDRSVPLELPWPLLVKLRPLVDSEGWTEAA